MMTRQEIFNTVARHLLTQGKPARSELGACYYRHKGLKCAAGALLPDDLELSDARNGIPFGKLREATPVLQEMFEDEDVAFIEALQNIHDVMDHVMWRKGLEAFSKRYMLSTRVIEEEFGHAVDE
jgi:hypothetical protein